MNRLLVIAGVFSIAATVIAADDKAPATATSGVTGTVNVMAARGYKHGDNWVSQKFLGAEHSERSWRQRVHVPLAFLLQRGHADTQAASPIEKYRQLEFPPNDENFSEGWRDRVVLEYEVINAADRESLRRALEDENPFVRSIAARAVGIRGDKESAGALAELALGDPEYFVRIRAVEALGLLKLKPEVIEAAMTDRSLGVQWTAKLAADQLKTDTDYAALVRQAFATGITRGAIGSAEVGKPAPDFTAQTSDGKPFKLSSLLGKKPLAIYFAAFDG
jgi:hypothetical protein